MKERGERSREGQKGGLSWIAMLAWIAAAFLAAGVIAYHLVAPFFHGR